LSLSVRELKQPKCALLRIDNVILSYKRGGNMVDVITDTKTVTVEIIQHADCLIQNIVAPSAVESGEPFDISYDCVNNGAQDTCYGQMKSLGTLIPGSRWDETLGSGAVVTKTVTIPGITDSTTYTIEVGYTK